MPLMVEPDASRPNWSAISGVLLCISWAPMAIVIPRLPDLDSMAEVNRFWEDNLALMQAVIASVSIGFMFLLVFLGGLAEWLRRAGGALAFASFGKGAFPRALGWLAVIGAIANIGALAGVVSLDGPLNSGNGVVGGIVAPLGLYLAWILSVSVWWLMREGRSEAPVHEGLEDLARHG